MKLVRNYNITRNVIRVILVLGSLLVAWRLPKKSFVKYLPVTLFSTAALFAQIYYLTVHKLWKSKGGISVMVCNTLVLIVGPFFFANLLVFHLAKGRFLLYALINIVADFIYAFPIMALFKKLGFFKIKLSSKVFYLIIVTNAFINYIFQKFYEQANVRNVMQNETLLLDKR
ncbi:hypothetical protein BEP19_02470 [Ammoniphilus oxalaticus]|uniref:Uncharacterized protein n=1 Tax=Ammoniphilus oxalaticus TaxID=66863 RepID=A0A419SNE1_9BACL|nr:hypothetical protein [Ammoniphilus oxalaticus]RKD25820.1 hypothetical protein BEP19_02470 [Ammoniphilus oxalaticus]